MRVVIVLTSWILISCSNTSIDLEQERKNVIRQLIDMPNQALVDKDAGAAVSAVPAAGDVFIANGDIFRRTKEEEKIHMQNEIRDVEYIKFEHLTEPEIVFLDERAITCYGVAKVKIDYKLRTDTLGVPREFIYSILFVGKRENEQWVMTAFSQSDKMTD